MSDKKPYSTPRLRELDAATAKHRIRHAELHQALDELAADFIAHTRKRPSETTVLELMQWSRAQIDAPDERDD